MNRIDGTIREKTLRMITSWTLPINTAQKRDLRPCAMYDSPLWRNT